MLDYLIFIVEIPLSSQDELSSWFFSRACLGIEVQLMDARARVRAYFCTESWNAALQDELLQRFPEVSILAATPIRLPEGSDRVPTIRPLSLAGQKLQLLSAPAFGSGAHPTTQLCAELLRRCEVRERRVLDVGTGTGILAILAARFGAAEIAAVEISPEARENAQANFELNKTHGISLHADLKEVEGTYDFILANLLTPTLLHLAEDIIERLDGGGICIVSGVTEGERGLILGRYEKRLRLLEESRHEEWLGLKFRLKSPSESGS